MLVCDAKNAAKAALMLTSPHLNGEQRGVAGTVCARGRARQGSREARILLARAEETNAALEMFVKVLVVLGNHLTAAVASA